MNTLSTIYRFTALALAMLVFVASVGITMDMHYCKGQLKSVSWFGKAKSCHEMASNNSTKQCPHHQKMMKQSKGESFDTKNCCTNTTVHFQADDDQKWSPTTVVLSSNLQAFLNAYVAAFFFNDEIVKESTVFARYKPPLIPRDIPVLTQSFLI